MKKLKRTLGKNFSSFLFKLVKERIVELIADEYQNLALNKYLIFGDKKNLSIHETVQVNNALFNLVSGKVSIAAYSFFGHNVSILTGTHDISKKMKQRQIAIPEMSRDIIIDEGVWIASNATVIGPCHIGKNAVVGSGVIVTGNIPDNTKITISKNAYTITSINYDNEIK